MKILFLGTLYPLEEENIILKKSIMGLQNQANTYQWDLIKGIDLLLETPIDIISVLPVGSYPQNYKDVILRSRTWSHARGSKNMEIGSINIPVLKQLERSIRVRLTLRKWIEINAGEERLHLVIYSTYLPFLLAIRSLPKKIMVTLIITDIPEYEDLSLSKKIISRILRLIQNKMIYKSINRADYFVLLTEHMVGVLEVKDKPYVIIEGIAPTVNSAERDRSIGKNSRFIILYTGTLHYQFGIKTLLEAFKLIDSEKYELWICGNGEAETEIRENCKVDKRIKFFGYVEKNVVKEFQGMATVLINPRPNEGEYTKYSFPSKTMEYMASGVPVIMHKLAGIPNEYDQYLYYFSGIRPKDIANKIIEICEKEESERLLFGERAKQFIINNKNSTIQANKVLEMMRKNSN